MRSNYLKDTVKIVRETVNWLKTTNSHTIFSNSTVDFMLQNVEILSENYYIRSYSEAIDKEKGVAEVYKDYLPLPIIILFTQEVKNRLGYHTSDTTLLYDATVDIVTELSKCTLVEHGSTYSDELQSISYGAKFFIGIHRNRIPYIIYKMFKGESIDTEAVNFVTNLNEQDSILHGSINLACNYLGINVITGLELVEEKNIDTTVGVSSFEVPPAKTLAQQAVQASEYSNLALNFLRTSDLTYTNIIELKDVEGFFFRDLKEKLKIDKIIEEICPETV